MFRLIIFSIIQSALLCIGQVLLKIGVMHMDRSLGWKDFILHSILTNWWLLGCGVTMTSTGLTWMYILRHFKFSYAYPLTALSFVFGMWAAMWVFKEQVNGWQWLGILLILLGCYLVTK